MAYLHDLKSAQQRQYTFCVMPSTTLVITLLFLSMQRLKEEKEVDGALGFPKAVQFDLIQAQSNRSSSGLLFQIDSIRG